MKIICMGKKLHSLSLENLRPKIGRQSKKMKGQTSLQSNAAGTSKCSVIIDKK